MASYLDKFLVKSAIEENTKLDLSCQHITTMDFMQLAPVYMKEMVPGEKIEITQETFTRLAPLTAPTFGRANFHNRAFFVPYRTVWKGWTDFITDTKHVGASSNSAISPYVPRIRNYDLLKAVLNSSATPASGGTSTTFGTLYAGAPGDLGDVDTYDLYFPGDSSMTERYMRFSARGRQMYKILNSLGYKLVPQTTTVFDVYYSALPLLSFLKVYLDWYFPSAYYDSVSRTYLEEILNRDNSVSGTYDLSETELRSILSVWLYVNYDSDYFVSAFDSPVGPIADSFTNVTMDDVTNLSTSNANKVSVRVTANNPTSIGSGNGTPYLTLSQNSTSTNGSITQYVIDGLKKLTDYMKRHQLVGARALDRYLARFGKVLSAEKINRSLYLSSASFPLQIGDVMSQSSTAGASLGDYAGKGLGYGGLHLEHDTDEYGLLLICSSIVPTIGYYQGIDKTVLHKNKLDFWTPEFDQLGTQPINSMELYLNTQDGSSVINSADGIFGFAPRYAEYKVGRDRLTGDFIVPTLSNTGDTSNVWHLFREFYDYTFVTADDVKHSESFVKGDDSYQYNRIFQINDLIADHFRVIHNFNVISYSPMHALYDSYEFDSEGKNIKADVNGVKVN